MIRAYENHWIPLKARPAIKSLFLGVRFQLVISTIHWMTELYRAQLLSFDKFPHVSPLHIMPIEQS